MEGNMTVKVPLNDRERKYKDKYGEEALRRMKALGVSMY